MSAQPRIHLRLRRGMPPARRRVLHDMTCRCHVCDPWKARKVEDAKIAAFRTILGLALGLTLGMALDLAIGGPGVLSIFGLGG